MARTILNRRTSTDEQKNGMAAQLDQVEGAAERERWPNPVVVTDEGVSGGTPATELDRLSRSMLDFAGLLDLAEGEGWSLVVLDLGIDTGTPQGKLIGHMVVALAQWEREIIGVRISRAERDRVPTPVGGRVCLPSLNWP